MQRGQLCRHCGSKCVDEPSESEPALIECVTCSGSGCEECNHEGRYKLTECPRKNLPLWIDELSEAAHYMEQGLPPVVGGSLDQAKWFLQACRKLKSEHAAIDEENAKR
jgi:hypothetical protein